MPKTHWTPQERATAIGIGFTRGGSVASEVTTIPRRTISRWLHQDGNDPVVASAILETERAAEIVVLAMHPAVRIPFGPAECVQRGVRRSLKPLAGGRWSLRGFGILEEAGPKDG